MCGGLAEQKDQNWGGERGRVDIKCNEGVETRKVGGIKSERQPGTHLGGRGRGELSTGTIEKGYREGVK